MKKVQVLGSGCSKCVTTAKYIEEVARDLGVPVEFEKVQDMRQIAAIGVMHTPAVAIDGKVVHSGSVPLRDKIATWLKPA
ncbi:MAG: TM0996/MTH895 family glutaredoxin-like protein [Betaproteobacteria bacterium]|nr:TM0996/MTH895 family glutaredoxin-like protein [Betaproteobacteria bacterium]